MEDSFTNQPDPPPRKRRRLPLAQLWDQGVDAQTQQRVLTVLSRIVSTNLAKRTTVACPPIRPANHSDNVDNPKTAMSPSNRLPETEGSHD